MITKEEKLALRRINEGEKNVVIPSRKVLKEAYFNAKTEFTTPFIVQNDADQKVVAMQISDGKTYYMTTEFAKKYIASIQKMINKIEGVADTDNEEVEALEQEMTQNESFKSNVEKAKKTLKLNEAKQDINSIIAVNEQDGSVYLIFKEDLKDDVRASLQKIYGNAFYDKGYGYIKIK